MADKILHPDDDTKLNFASEDDLEKALVEGYEGDNRTTPEVKNEPDPEPPAKVVAAVAKEVAVDKAGIADLANADTDDWAGIPDNIKKRFDTISNELNRVTNIANSASGRANKLQSQIQRQEQVAPKPTSQQLMEAMTDKTKREILRKDWASFADALDENDRNITNSIGGAIDNLRTELSTNANQVQSGNDVKRLLDINHAGWENTVQQDEFKEWVYANGPSPEDRAKYEQTLGYANNLMATDPAGAAVVYKDAQTFYDGLLRTHPVWAQERGNLYGNASGEAALQLLDLHKAAQGVTPEVTQQNLQDQNLQRLADNVTPTQAASYAPPADTDGDVDAAFQEGYYK